MCQQAVNEFFERHGLSYKVLATFNWAACMLLI